MRSSVKGVWCRPYSLPRNLTNCHMPPAALLDMARGMKADSESSIESNSAGLAGHGAGDEAGLGLGEVDELLGQAFFIEDALDHGTVTAGTLDGVDDGLVAVVHEVVDIAEDGVVDAERELGDGGGDLLADLVFELGVDREGHREDVLEGCFFELAVVNDGGGAHAGEIEAVDGVGHFVELVVELLAVGGILVEGVEEQVDGGIEFAAHPQ